MRKPPPPRLLVSLFVGSVLANTVLGIWALLSGDFGQTEGKVLGTSFLASASMLSLLINTPAIRQRALWPAPIVGAVTGASGFALFIALVWTEPVDDWWFKLAGSFLVVAGAATLASTLALITSPAGLRWLQPVGSALITLLGFTILVGLWAEPDVDWYVRLVGIEGVLVAAITLLIPILSRFSSSHRREATREDSTLGPVAVRFCPSCGQPISHGPAVTGRASVCDACGLTFEVRASPEARPVES